MAKAADKATAMWVIRRLRRAGHQALLAGGCVRDMLLGVRPADYDIATDATPDQVAKLFKRVLLIGAKFGVAVVMRGERAVEVATFRTDISYSDGRRPDSVRFSTAREDARRRDFTINGMFFDPITEEVIDYAGGREDLRRKVVRAIGSPAKRFSEDYLRMIRAVRFAVRLGFRMDNATAAAISKQAGSITGISGERIFDELTKILSHRSAAEGLNRLNELGLARRILPELFADDEIWPAVMWRAKKLAARRDSVLMLAATLGDLRVRQLRRIVRRWGASNNLRDAILFCSQNLQQWREADSLEMCELKRMMADENFGRLQLLWAAEEQRQTGRVILSRRLKARADSISPEQVAPQPFVTGDDLLKMGITEGPQVGRILRRLYDAQLNEEIKTRSQATAMARKLAAASKDC